MKGKTKLVCFDLCCGAGALSAGFRAAGAEILGGIDVDERALRTARINHPTGVWERVSIEQFAAALVQNENHVIWRANTLLAGLPCQGYSRAGNRDPNDPRNSLYRHLVDVAAKLEPAHVVFENVLGITTSPNKAALRGLEAGLRRLGYDVAVRILNAADFGVPQLRKRVFLVGVREGPADWVFECLIPKTERQTVRAAFRGLRPNRPNRKRSHVFMKHGPGVTRKLRTLEPGGPISYRRLTWDSCAPTLVAGHRALPVHPVEPRAISVREAARLQGFPDTYRFLGSNSAQIEQVANAVPPPLAQAIARGLMRRPKHARRVRGPLYRKLRRHNSAELRRRFSRAFVATFRKAGRKFPWRTLRDPFRVLITELLLQRTNAKLARTVWDLVLAIAPTPSAAAKADLRSLNSLTQRIGIRSRARTIKSLGQALTEQYGGRVPKEFEELMRLPGVGLYIASAVRSLCLGSRDFPVDSNAFRFVSRYFGVKLKGKKSEGRQLREFLTDLLPQKNISDYVYGFLDFAALVCRPINPDCDRCPLRTGCHEFRRKCRMRSELLEKDDSLLGA